MPEKRNSALLQCAPAPILHSSVCTGSILRGRLLLIVSSAYAAWAATWCNSKLRLSSTLMQDEEKPLPLWLRGSGAAEIQPYKPDMLVCVLAATVQPQQQLSQAMELGLVWRCVLVIQALHWNRAPPRQRGWAGNTSHLSHQRCQPRHESGEKQEVFSGTPKRKTWVPWCPVSHGQQHRALELSGGRIRRGKKRPERHSLMLQASPGRVHVCLPLHCEESSHCPISLPRSDHAIFISFLFPSARGDVGLQPQRRDHTLLQHGGLPSKWKGDKNWGDWEKPKLWGHPSFEGHGIIFCTGTPGASLLRGLVPGSSHGLLPWFYSCWAQTTGM